MRSHSRLAFVLPAVTLAGCGQVGTSSRSTSNSSTSKTTVPSQPTTPVSPLTTGERAIVVAIAKLPRGGDYPNPVAAKSNAINSGAGCPSMTGVKPRTALTAAKATAIENTIGSELRGGHATFVRDFDRAMLDVPHNGFAQLFGPSLGANPMESSFTTADVSVESLINDDSLASAVTSACGRAVVAASWRVVFCSPSTAVKACDPGITTTELMINRGGRWLIWYVGSGLQ